MRSATSTKRSVFVRGLLGTIKAELLAPSRRAVLSVRTMMRIDKCLLVRVVRREQRGDVRLMIKVAATQRELTSLTRAL